MGPHELGALSAILGDRTRDRHQIAQAYRTAIAYSTVSSQSPGAYCCGPGDAEPSFPPTDALTQYAGLSARTQTSSPSRDLHLATEDEIAELFDDCQLGAVPPLGPAYGIETLLDESLTSLADVYFEAGDHVQLVHLSGEDFQALLSGARRGYYSHDS